MSDQSQTQAQPQAPSPEPQTFSVEYVKELRNEAASHRVKANEAEKARQAAEEAGAKAEQAAAARIQEAENAANARIIRAELKAAALKAGMVDLDGLKLADLSGIKLAESGEVEGADELMESLKKAKPYLFGEPRNTSHTSSPPPPKAPETKSARDMTPEEYKAAKSAMLRQAR